MNPQWLFYPFISIVTNSKNPKKLPGELPSSLGTSEEERNLEAITCWSWPRGK